MVTVYTDHLRNDVTHSTLFVRLFLLAKGIHVIHCAIEKRAIGDMPVSCCAVNCTNRFMRDAGIEFNTIPAKQMRREACLRAISQVGWEVKSSDRYCGEHFVSGSLSRDPKNVDCVPTLFKGGRRRVNCSIPDQNREERSAKRAKVCEDEEDVLTAAEGLLHMSAMTSSHEDTLRDASIQTDHAFPMLDPSSSQPGIVCKGGCLAGRAGWTP